MPRFVPAVQADSPSDLPPADPLKLFAEPLVQDPTALAALLAATLGLVFFLSTRPGLKKLFSVLPPVIWAYFVPLIYTTVGVTPSGSATYSWFSYVLLPFALFLLMLTIDLKAILSLGPLALIMLGSAVIIHTLTKATDDKFLREHTPPS